MASQASASQALTMASTSPPAQRAAQPYTLPNTDESKISLPAPLSKPLSEISEDECSDANTDGCFSECATPANEAKDALDFDEPKHKEQGMTSSLEPNKRYNGGSKDSLFGERHGRVPFGMGGSGGDDGNEDNDWNSDGGDGEGRQDRQDGNVLAKATRTSEKSKLWAMTGTTNSSEFHGHSSPPIQAQQTHQQSGEPAELHVGVADIGDPEWRRRGMASSREPNERYNGGSKDSLFGERYGKEAGGVGGAGKGDHEKDQPEKNERGGGAGDSGGGGGRRGGGSVNRKSSSSASGSASRSSNGSTEGPVSYGDRITRGTDYKRIPVENHSNGDVEIKHIVNRKGQRVVIHYGRRT